MLAKRPDGFGNAMMFTLMVETYALLSLIISVFPVSYTHLQMPWVRMRQI